MKNFSKFIGNMAKIVTKIVEVFQWVGAGLMLAATVCALVNPDWVGYFIGYDAKECCGADLSVYGFEIHAAVTDGQIDMTALCLFGIGATLILAMMLIIRPITGTAIEKIPISRNIRTLSGWNGVLPSDFLIIKWRFLKIIAISARMRVAPIPNKQSAVISI